MILRKSGEKERGEGGLDVEEDRIHKRRASDPEQLGGANECSLVLERSFESERCPWGCHYRCFLRLRHYPLRVHPRSLATHPRFGATPESRPSSLTSKRSFRGFPALSLSLSPSLPFFLFAPPSPPSSSGLVDTFVAQIKDTQTFSSTSRRFVFSTNSSFCKFTLCCGQD